MLTVPPNYGIVFIIGVKGFSLHIGTIISLFFRMEVWYMEKNKTVGNDKISALFDAGTFVETNAYLKRKGEADEYEGVISGYGAIDGKLAFAFVQDSDRMKGAFDVLAAKKIAALYDTATKNGAPVIGVFDSTGAVVTEGSEVLSAYGRFIKCVSDASGVIPQIAVVSGACTGISSVAASMFDVMVTVGEKASVTYHPAFNVGNASAANAKACVSDVDAKDEKQAFAVVRKLISLLPQNNAEGVVVSENADDPNRLVEIGTMAETVKNLADSGSVVTLEECCQDGVETSLAKLGGVTVGFIGISDVIDPCGAKKAAWFTNLCDSFRIPVITLVDCEGVTSDSEENETLAPSLASFAAVYAAATTPKISVVTGKAYGAAFALAASKTIGADIALALEDAQISPMSPAAAVAFLCNDQVTAEKSRADVEKDWAEKNAKADIAASNGDIDDIVAPSELRQRLCAAVYMLMKKSDVALSRKHSNLPL